MSVFIHEKSSALTRPQDQYCPGRSRGCGAGMAAVCGTPATAGSRPAAAEAEAAAGSNKKDGVAASGDAADGEALETTSPDMTSGAAGGAGSISGPSSNISLSKILLAAGSG